MVAYGCPRPFFFTKKNNGEKMIKAVLFDLDGTLVNSLTDLSVSVNYALEHFDFPIHKTEEYKYFAGDGIPKMIERALPQENRNQESVEKVKKVFLDYYSVHYADNTCAYSGMTELLNRLKKSGIKLAVVTNKAQEMADKVVKKTYGDLFDVIFGKREGIPAKPNPAAALIVMDMLGVKPRECIFLGDSANDVLTGFNSGAVAVGELWGFRDRAELSENHARFIINAPNELIEIIDKVNNSII